MVHRFRSVVVALMLLLVLPVPGWAAGKDGWWGWLERLSGPGPFRTVAGTFSTRLCKGPEHKFLIARDADARIPCFYADVGRWISEDDRTVGEDVRLTTIDLGVTYQVYRGIELGLGLGVFRFSTETQSDPVRFVAVPGRLVIKPIQLLTKLAPLFGGKEVPSNSAGLRRAGALRWFYKTSILFGGIDSSDFGANTILSFRERNEAVSSTGLMLDVYELLGK